MKSLKANGSSKKTPQDKSKDVVGSSHIRLKSRCEEPVSFSSPVLASGGKRARKSKDITTQGSHLRKLLFRASPLTSIH